MLREDAVRRKDDDGWQDQDLQRALAHVTPLVVAMAKAAPALKAAQALSFYQGGRRRNISKTEEEEEEEPDIRLDHIRPQRLRGQGIGRGPGYITTKTGKGLGWDDISTGRTVDSPVNRFTVDPYDDTPKLHTIHGRKYKSKTKWDKRNSGS